MSIQFVDLKKQYQSMKEEMDEAVLNVLQTTSFILGEEVSKLEKSLSEYTGAKHTISCSSGTDALLMSLMALNIKPDDEVITTPFTFIATAEAIALLKAIPVFVDIDPATYNIDPSQIEKKITSRTKAIIPVGIFGQCADMDEIKLLAEKRNIAVIEDACQSFGAEYKGKKSCNLSAIGCTSFFPSKPLGCYGDGGAIFTNDDDLAERLRSIMNHGQVERYVHKYIGINGRLDAIQAAVLNVKLKYFDQEIQSRKRIGERYTLSFDKMKEHLVLPFIEKDRTTVYAQYSVRIQNRESVIAKLNSVGIPTAIHYPIPLYRQEVFSDLRIRPEDFPVTENVSKEIMSLPMSPYLSDEDQDYVISYLSKFIGE